MGRKYGIQPKIWKSGPDPIDHKLYTDCQRARAQAWYRGEEWTITEQEYIELWRRDDRYLKKGRGTEDLCLVRLDYEDGWHIYNVDIISRLDHYRVCHEHKIGKFAQGKKRQQRQEQLRRARSRIQSQV
jgi:hypothetical protein